MIAKSHILHFDRSSQLELLIGEPRKQISGCTVLRLLFCAMVLLLVQCTPRAVLNPCLLTERAHPAMEAFRGYGSLQLCDNGFQVHGTFDLVRDGTDFAFAVYTPFGQVAMEVVADADSVRFLQESGQMVLGVNDSIQLPHRSFFSFPIIFSDLMRIMEGRLPQWMCNTDHFFQGLRIDSLCHSHTSTNGMLIQRCWNRRRKNLESVQVHNPDWQGSYIGLGRFRIGQASVVSIVRDEKNYIEIHYHRMQTRAE